MYNLNRIREINMTRIQYLKTSAFKFKDNIMKYLFIVLVLMWKKNKSIILVIFIIITGTFILTKICLSYFIIYTFLFL